MKKYLLEISLLFIIVFVISYFFTILMKKVAHHIKAMDIPKDDRRVHNKPMPRLGGGAIMLSLLIGYMIQGTNFGSFNAIIFAAIILFLIGVVDDINSIKAKHKFLGQILVSIIAVAYGKVLLDSISIFGLEINFGIYAYPLTVIFLVSCINIINLIDGLDGLAGGISFIFFATIAIISLLLNRFNTPEIVLSVIMMGSILGFLCHNFHPASIFAGDSGSMLMGYMIGVVSLLGYKGAMFGSILTPITIIFIPVIDTTFAILRRKLNHQPVFEADKNHLHHQLLKKNLGQTKTVLIIYAICILFSLTSILKIYNSKISIILYVILALLLCYFIMFTNILFDKSKKKKDKWYNINRRLLWKLISEEKTSR